MRELFEAWVTTQFVGYKINLIAQSPDGSYEHSEVNTLWVGFCAGYLLAANK